MIPVAPARFSRGNQLALLLFFQNHFNRDPILIAQSADRRAFFRGKKTHHLSQLGFGHIHLQSDLGPGFDRAFQKHRDVFHLFALPGTSHAFLLAMKRMVLWSSVSSTRRLLARMLLPVSVRSTMASSSLRLDFGRAPGEFNRDVNALLFKIASRDVDQFGRDDSAGQILGLLHLALIRHRQHPARRLCGGAAVGQFANLDDIIFVAVLDDPVMAGQTAIDDPINDIAADFLRRNNTDETLSSSTRGKTLRESTLIL